MAYTSEEFEILFDIQGAAAKIGLPIVIAVLKHTSRCHEQGVRRSNLLADIRRDEDLRRVGYEINSEQIVDEAINKLVRSDFLREDNDKIMLEEKGQEAIRILMLQQTD